MKNLEIICLLAVAALVQVGCDTGDMSERALDQEAGTPSDESAVEVQDGPEEALRRSGLTFDAQAGTVVSGDGKCLDVHYPDRFLNGGRVQIWDCHGGINQQWHLEGGALVSGNGKCLDVHHPDRFLNGGRVQIWDCHGGENQQWNVEGSALVSDNGKCLDVHGPERHLNGGRVQIWDCHGGINQQWHL